MSDDKNNPSDPDEEKTSVVASETFRARMHEAGQAPPALVLLMGPSRQVGKQWYITKKEMVMGRALDSHIFVDDRSMSRKHARVLLKGNSVTITDLESANGTEIDGGRIDPNKEYPLRNNDQIKTGNVIFKYLEQGNIETVGIQKVFDRAEIDPLTEIFNKGALLSKGDELFKKAKLTEIPLTVIVFDLDNFKSVNDTYGHPAGDFVLKELTYIIKENLIRRDDFFARYGGEEFCLILFGGDLRRGIEVAERIRSTIEKHQFIYKENTLPVTLSLGVATLEANMDSWDTLFEKADQASYISKKNGKNRVSTI